MYVFLGCTEEIERLRPKTPPPREKKPERGGLTGSSVRGGRGRGHQSSRSERGNSSPNPALRTGGLTSLPAAGSYSQYHEPRDAGTPPLYRNESRNRTLVPHARESSRDRSNWRDSGRSTHGRSRTTDRSYPSR